MGSNGDSGDVAMEGKMAGVVAGVRGVDRREEKEGRIVAHCPHTTCACASGCAGFFACTSNCKHSHHFPTDIVDHFQIAPYGSLSDWPSLSTPLAAF
jgi:hypothetical protein